MPTPSELADASFSAVMAKDKAGWLALFADDAVMHDPVGPAPYDPEGKGFHGKREIERLWDTVIAPTHALRFVTRERFVGGDESCTRFTVYLTPAPGAEPVEIQGMAIHVRNAEGKMVLLKSYLTPATSRHAG